MTPFDPTSYLSTYYQPGRWYDDDDVLVKFVIANLGELYGKNLQSIEN